MGFNTNTVTMLLTLVGGTLGIALELLLLHTLVRAKQWLETRVQVASYGLYVEIVRASINYSEEWAHSVRESRATPRTITGTDKLNQALQFVRSRVGETLPQLEADIHAELGRRRGLVAIAIPRLPPPLPKKAA